MSLGEATKYGLCLCFVGWFVSADYMEREFRRNEICYMRDLVRELQSHHSDRGDKSQSIVLTEALDAAGANNLTGPERLRVCLDARRVIDDAMQGALNGEGVLSASVELWSIHDDSIAEFCRQTIVDRKPFKYGHNSASTPG